MKELALEQSLHCRSG